MVGAMAKSIPEELEKLEAQKKKLEEKSKRLKHQQQYKTRKEDARRKIITGGAMLAATRDGMVSQALLAHVLNKYVTGKNEREFMGLPPKEVGSSEGVREETQE